MSATGSDTPSALSIADDIDVERIVWNDNDGDDFGAADSARDCGMKESKLAEEGLLNTVDSLFRLRRKASPLHADTFSGSRNDDELLTGGGWGRRIVASKVDADSKANAKTTNSLGNEYTGIYISNLSRGTDR